MTAVALQRNQTWFMPAARVRSPSKWGLTDASSTLTTTSYPSTSAFGNDWNSTWIEPTLERLVQISMLGPNWDHQGAVAIRPEIIQFTWQLLTQTLGTYSPSPQIVPLSYGGIQLEWHESGIDLEIEVIAPNRIFVSFEDSVDQIEFEEELQSDFKSLRQPIRLLTCR